MNGTVRKQRSFLWLLAAAGAAYQGVFQNPMAAPDILVASTLVTASAVSVSGMIGWVGLVIPHMTRRVVGSDYHYPMPASIYFGEAPGGTKGFGVSAQIKQRFMCIFFQAEGGGSGKTVAFLDGL